MPQGHLLTVEFHDDCLAVDDCLTGDDPLTVDDRVTVDDPL